MQKQEEDEKPRESCSLQPDNKKMKKFRKWFSLIDAVTISKKEIPAKKQESSLFLNKQLHKTLYGFIVFEVEWNNVRGINYLNELQTDTSLAIEAKLMRRWEFEGIDQAIKSMSQWFSGSKSERFCLRKYLYSIIGEVFHDAEEDFSKTSTVDDDEHLRNIDNVSVETDSPCCSRSVFNVNHYNADYDENVPHTPPNKRRKVTKEIITGVEVDYIEETPKSHVSDVENIIEATQYKDVLVLVRFGDRDLPFKLREVIMADVRLLTLLEAGLPSWVLFLQSYPGFCHLYRPWMCLFARALYIIISITTVVIGFYDLYKNVPVLKAAASRFFGPLFDWVETWDMVSRIKYLGTMLFLHNFQKAVQWALAMARALQPVVMPLVNPLSEFLGLFLPLWSSFVEMVASLVSMVWIVIESGCNLVGDVVELVFLPIWWVFSLLWSITNTVLVPLFWIIWEVVYAPIRVILALINCLALSFAYMLELFGDIWRYTSSILKVASDTQVVAETSKLSMGRTLWEEVFSPVVDPVFRALKSIVHGLVAFFAACNRHRLSIYNHIQEFIKRLQGRPSRSQSTASRNNNSAKKPNHSGDGVRKKLHYK